MGDMTALIQKQNEHYKGDQKENKKGCYDYENYNCFSLLGHKYAFLIVKNKIQ